MADLVTINGGMKFKLVFLGDQGVGKSALARRLIYEDFERSYQSTIGIDFATKTVHIDDNVSVILQLWDTAGQERFRCLIPSYIRDSHVLLVVFDVTNPGSFRTAVHEWVRMARGVLNPFSDTEPRIVVIGNKVDQDDARKVTFEEASRASQELGLPYFEASALTGLNVKEIFVTIARDLHQEHTNIETKKEPRGKKKQQILKPPVVNAKRERKGCEC